VEALVFDSSKLTACKAIIVRVDLTHLCISIAYIHKMQSLYLPACVRTKAQTIVIAGKKCIKKAQKLKKFGLGRIEPTAEVVNHCLSTWF